jgi:hypothetical protein
MKFTDSNLMHDFGFNLRAIYNIADFPAFQQTLQFPLSELAGGIPPYIDLIVVGGARVRAHTHTQRC